MPDRPDTHRRRELRLWWALITSALLGLTEIVASTFTGSVALLADGFHNADDVAGLLIAIFSERYTSRYPGIHRTIGFKQLNKLTGFAKGTIFVMSSVIILFKIAETMAKNEPVDSWNALWVGCVALVLNYSSALLLRGSQKTFDRKTAYNALAYDAIGSLTVVLCSIASITLQAPLFDVLAAAIIGLWMLRSGSVLLYKGRKLFMRSVPIGFDFAQFAKQVSAIPGVTHVTDIHLWKLTEADYHLTARVSVDATHAVEAAYILKQAHDVAHDRFGIRHCTIEPRFNAALPKKPHSTTQGTVGSAIQFSAGGSPLQGHVLE